MQQSYASQLSETKARTELSLLEPIHQHFEHVQVETQLKRPRTVNNKLNAFIFISKTAHYNLKILMALKSALKFL